MTWLTGLVTAAFFLLLLRLFQLQILNGSDMERQADKNRTQIIPLLAPRGLVFDRRGELLLDNAPRFSLFFAEEPGAESAAVALEADLVRRFPAVKSAVHRKLTQARLSGKMTRLLANVPRGDALALLERRATYPGLHVIVEPQRRMRFPGVASHLLGYVDEIDADELERLRSRNLRAGQLIGRAGIERAFDADLRGQDGGLQFLTDASGRHVQVLQRIPSSPGADLYLTIDHRIQAAAEEGLAASPTRKGAAVVLDPRTGEILALASKPSYDINEGIAAYLGDAGLPFFNRALQGTYPPGSIFKIMTAAAGLQEASWNTRRVYDCTGSMTLGDKEFGCWKIHHRQDFFGAVAWSCNVYFYNMGQETGADAIERAARAFGLGEKTGIDLPSESSGLIPGKEWKRRTGRGGWSGGDTMNFCIGQGAVLVTPLQAAVMMSAVANGGTVWKPYVVDRLQGEDGVLRFRRTPTPRKTVVLSPETWEKLHRAVGGVVTSGSGRGVWREDLQVSAKTGTAQNPHGEDHSWFACSAARPGEAASLAAVVFVENGGQGSAAAGPVARRILEAAYPLPVKTAPLPAGLSPATLAVPPAPLPTGTPGGAP